MGIQTNNIVADLDREFHGMVAKIAAEPDAQERFDRLTRAWKRAHLVPGEPSTDATLLAAWEEWKAGANSVNEHRGYDTPLGSIASARHDAAREIIMQTAATSAVGVAVKLRAALYNVADTEHWVSVAIEGGDDTTLLARAAELSEEGRLIVDAIGFLTRPAPSRADWEKAMAALAEAKAATKEPSRDMSLEADEARGANWTDAEDRLLDMPAPDVAALAWKLEWLLNPKTGASPQPLGGASILADAHRLAGDTLLSNPRGWGEPHMGWLQSYQASRAELDVLPDDESTGDKPLLGRVNRLEAMILREPAHSKDAVLAKLFTAARVSADGGEPDTSLMQALVAEAEAAFGFAPKAAVS